MSALTRLLAAVTATGAALARERVPSDYNEIWLTPTAEPGMDESKRPTYQGVMPIGNGDVTALVWPNISTGAVSFFIQKQDGMSSSTELFKLARMTVQASPNPFTNGSYFNQTMDMVTGSVLIHAGGSNLSTHALSYTVWVDANSNSIMVQVQAHTATPFALSVATHSTRPATEWTYSIDFVCFQGVSQPDVFVDPLPPAWPQGAVGSYHHNDPQTDGNNIQATLAQQGLASIVDSVPDHWSNLTFGSAVAGVDATGTPLQRATPNTLTSAAASTSFTLTIVALSAITPDVTDWITATGSALATALSVDVNARRAAHEAWWAAFWARSYVDVSINTATSPTYAAYAARALPIPNDTILWLAADAITGVTSGSPLTSWPDASTSRANATQAQADLQPVYQADGFGPGLPAVIFNGDGNFLGGSGLSVPTTHTVVAAFRDDGSPSVCCSGVLFLTPSHTGVGTAAVTPTSTSSDDDSNVFNNTHVVVQLDWPGSGEMGAKNVLYRPVIATAMYDVDTSLLFEGACQVVNDHAAHGATADQFMVGTRNNELGRYFRGAIAEILVYPRVLSAPELTSVEAYLSSKWNVSSTTCPQDNDPGFELSTRYAQTRYVNAIQNRNTIWPVKFNGQSFTNPMGDNGEAEYRQWGPSNWWQNTREIYFGSLAAGDVDVFKVGLEYIMNMLPFAQARTQAYFNHTGIYFTETKTIYGAYASQDYGCAGSRPAGYPVWLENNDYIHLDYAGDGGTPEMALMALDYLLYTNDTVGFQRYLPIATLAADFFRQHYANRTADGEYVYWPTQALETFWCAGWDTVNNRPPPNCCVNDMPLVAGMHTLLSKLLALPPSLTTPAQRAEWSAFLAAQPDVPVVNETLVAAGVISSGVHNDETPELYAVHPYRFITTARNATGAVPPALMTAALNALHSNAGNSHANSGWQQAPLNAALLGDATSAAGFVLDRASTPIAPGFRFRGFASHMQDFQPSADHFSVFMAGVNWMLLQPADDGFAGSMLALPAWPCDYDVSFKLMGPMNTSVEVVFANGTLVSVAVEPPERASAVTFANCVPPNAAQLAMQPRLK